MSPIIETVTGVHATVGESLLEPVQLTNSGRHNGYSKYPCDSHGGRYFIAYCFDSSNADLYTADGEFVRALVCSYDKGSAPGIGEFNDIRWSCLPGEEDCFYYTRWEVLLRQHAATGVDTIIGKWSPNFDHEGHAAQSTLRCMWHKSLGNSLVYDLMWGKLVGTVRGNAEPSPSGRWVLLFSEGKMWAVADGAVRTVPNYKNAHDGWAWLADGREVYVYQGVDDWITAYQPDTDETLRIARLSHFAANSDCNFHLSVMPASRPGWILMSTYGGSDWSANQLLLLELVEQGRIIRLGSTMNTWPMAASPTKDGSYFAEAFASISPSGNSIYWGANQNDVAQVDLYHADITPAWYLLTNPTPPQEPPVLGKYIIHHPALPAWDEVVTLGRAL